MLCSRRLATVVLLWMGSALLGAGAEATPPSRSATNLEGYREALDGVRREKVALLGRYRNAGTDSPRDLILREAGDVFREAVARDIAPFWYGTPWDFNGTTEQPGTGAIACGYFVTTVLRDAGVQLERVRLAQQLPRPSSRSSSGPPRFGGSCCPG